MAVAVQQQGSSQALVAMENFNSRVALGLGWGVRARDILTHFT
jgi:hypothetical protein